MKICLSLPRLLWAYQKLSFCKENNWSHFIIWGVGGEKRRNNMPGGTFSISSDYFFCLVSFTVHFWHVLSAKSARLVKNSRVVFEGLLYDCNFLPLQAFRTLFVCQYLCWQIYVNSLNNVENVLWGQVYSGFLVYNVGRLYSCACDELFVRRLVERWLSGGAQVSQNQQSKLPVSSSKYNTQKIYFYLKDICKCVGWK